MHYSIQKRKNITVQQKEQNRTEDFGTENGKRSERNESMRRRGFRGWGANLVPRVIIPYCLTFYCIFGDLWSDSIEKLTMNIALPLLYNS